MLISYDCCGMHSRNAHRCGYGWLESCLILLLIAIYYYAFLVDEFLKCVEISTIGAYESCMIDSDADRCALYYYVFFVT